MSSAGVVPGLGYHRETGSRDGQSQVAVFKRAVVVLLIEDDVAEQFYAQNLAGGLQVCQDVRSTPCSSAVGVQQFPFADR